MQTIYRKNTITYLSCMIVAWIVFLCPVSGKTMQTVRVVAPSNIGPVGKRAAEILVREITGRSGASVLPKGKAALTVELTVKPGIGVQGFSIAGAPEGPVKITGNDENGLLYGVGKFLHTSRYDQGGFTPGTWRGTDVPTGTMRGVYFATHFRNYYEEASDEELQRYLESIALWGANAFIVVYPNQWLSGFDDPKSAESLRKLRLLMTKAKSVGMQVGTFATNSGFTSAPQEFRGTPAPKLYGDVLLCPNKPAAMEYMLDYWKHLLEAFSQPGLDLVIYWPYDEGGCACEKCVPWGSNGYPNMCRAFSKATREKFPKAKFIMSTWMFDTGEEKGDGRPMVPLKMDGEYAGLDRFLEKDKSWLDYILSDAHEDFPPYPLKVRSPGGLPLLNFSEISMYGQWPWGAYGANPFPVRLQKLWDQTKGKLLGGFPYSEGIYEDMDQVICDQFYWNPKKTARETLAEYISYEYSPDVVQPVMEAIAILEQNHVKGMVVEQKNHPSGNNFLFGYFKQGCRVEFQNARRQSLTEVERQALPQTTEKAFQLLEQVDKRLSSQVRTSWRWRILYLRALIDRELVRTDGWFQGPVLQKAFAELTQIYHSENTGIMVHVPKIEDAEVRFDK